MSHNTTDNEEDRLPSSDLEGSTMGIPNIHTTNSEVMPSIPTYPEGQYEDDKAQLIAKLLQNHGGNFGKFLLLFISLFFEGIDWGVVIWGYCYGNEIVC